MDTNDSTNATATDTLADQMLNLLSSDARAGVERQLRQPDLPGFTGGISRERFPMYGVTGRGPFLVTIETRHREPGSEGMRSEGPQREVARFKSLRAADRMMDDLNSRVNAALGWY